MTESTPTADRHPVPATWATTSRWTVAHLIIEGSDYFDFNVTTWMATACGRNVNKGRLEPERTRVDTQDRCPACRKHAAVYDADGAS